MEPADLPDAPPLLDFLDAWSRSDSKANTTFDSVLKPEDETVGLEVLRTINSLRSTVCCKPGTGTGDQVDQAQLDRITEYLCALEALVNKLEMDRTRVPLVTYWTSPLSGKTSHYYKLKGLACDMGMATFLYASALRAMAVQKLDAAWMQGGSTDDAEVHTVMAAAAAEASTQLRKAAGVHAWLTERGLPRVAEQLPADRPAELLMSMSKVMTQVCLAESQVVAAARAGQRGVSAALVCALHAGAWECWETAAKTLKENTGDLNTVSDRLRRYLAASSAVSHARALRWLAIDYRDGKQQAGQAEAACIAAAGLLNSARMAADIDASWRQVVAQEAALLEETRSRCEKMRVSVTYQTVSKTPPDLPPGKVLVTVIPFNPSSPAQPGSRPGSDTGEQDGGDGRDSGSRLARALSHSLSLRNSK